MKLLSEVFEIDIMFILCLIIGILYYYGTKTFNHFSSRGIKFMKPLPFFGNTIELTLHRTHFMTYHKKIYDSFRSEKFVGFYSNRTPFLMIRDCQLIQQILIKDFSHFYDRGRDIDEKLDPLRAYNLVNLQGKKWKSLRQKLTPAFSSGKLKFMFQQVCECGDELLQHLNSLTNHKTPADILEVMAKFSTDVIGTCAFGLQFNSLKDPDSKFRRIGRDIFKPTFGLKIRLVLSVIHEKLPSLLKIKTFKKEYEEFFINLVKDTVNYRKDNNVERNDFIQILMSLSKNECEVTDNNNEQDNNSGEDNVGKKKDNGILLNDKVLAANTFVFFVAGFETTASTISYCLFELSLSHNINIQNRVRTEILSVTKKHNNKITDDSIKDMTYLDCVIAETLRKYPVAGILVRICTKPYIIPDTNIMLKKGEHILIPVYAIHHDPEYYPQPDLFDPDRFTEENKAKRPSYTYLPFGDGPRACIGSRFALIELKTALAKILTRFEVKLNDKTQLPIEWNPRRLLLSPKQRILLDFKPLV